MLVLSRRLHEKIVIPEIAATIQIVGIKRSAVRIGIDAPPRVHVVWAEVDRAAADTMLDPTPAKLAVEPKIRPGLRRSLKTVSMQLGLARLQLDAGLSGDLAAALKQAHLQIQRLQRNLERRRPRAKFAETAAESRGELVAS